MDGSTMHRQSRAKYLGTILANNDDNLVELNNRIAEVTTTCARMTICWHKADTTNNKWKLRVYDAIIKSKLLFGLETMQLTKNEQQKLDSFQIRGSEGSLRFLRHS